MTSSSSSSSTASEPAASGSTASDYAVTLTQVAAAFQQQGNRPPAQAVVRALLAAEKAAKQQRSSYPLASLLGQWRLCFTAPRNSHFKGNAAIGKGLYIPQITPAQISFSALEPDLESDAGKVAIGNQVQVGFVVLRLTGPARYLGKKNLLAFNFTQIQLSLWGQTVYQGGFRGGQAQTENFERQPIAKLPFFAFFLVTESLIAARGRGGGLAIWVRQ